MMLEFIERCFSQRRTVTFNSDGHRGHSVPIATFESKKEADAYIASRNDPASYKSVKA